MGIEVRYNKGVCLTIEEGLRIVEVKSPDGEFAGVHVARTDRSWARAIRGAVTMLIIGALGLSIGPLAFVGLTTLMGAPMLPADMAPDLAASRPELPPRPQATLPVQQTTPVRREKPPEGTAPPDDAFGLLR